MLYQSLHQSVVPLAEWYGIRRTLLPADGHAFSVGRLGTMQCLQGICLFHFLHSNSEMVHCNADPPSILFPLCHRQVQPPSFWVLQVLAASNQVIDGMLCAESVLRLHTHLVLLAKLQAASDADVMVATPPVAAGAVHITDGSCAAVTLQPLLERHLWQ